MMLLVIVLGLFACEAWGRDGQGRWQATVVEVLDGDSLRADVVLWPDITQRIIVRIAGIDAPELHGARCPEERDLAIEARDTLRQLVGAGPVTLRALTLDKYGGRVVARVETVDGIDVGATLRTRGLARAYTGGSRSRWCLIPADPSTTTTRPAGTGP
jgi:endonuclease YncB( thermonuclease family)